jgi:hypothetical protein
MALFPRVEAWLPQHADAQHGNGHEGSRQHETESKAQCIHTFQIGGAERWTEAAQMQTMRARKRSSGNEERDGNVEARTQTQNLLSLLMNSQKRHKNILYGTE